VVCICRSDAVTIDPGKRRSEMATIMTLNALTLELAVVPTRIRRKAMAPLEATRLPWAQRSASTSWAHAVLGSRTLAAHKSQPTLLQVKENARSTKLLALIKRISVHSRASASVAGAHRQKRY